MDDLSRRIQTFFLEQYQDLSATTTFLAFEPLGCIINPDEYKDPATNQFMAAKADEDIAEIVDRVPEISEVFIPGLNQVSAQYGALVNGATFNDHALQAPDAASSDYLALLGKLKNEALRTLADADRMSIVAASGKYFPVATVPGTWYDAQSPIWASKEFKADKLVPAQAPSPDFLPSKAPDFLPSSTPDFLPAAAVAPPRAPAFAWRTLAVDKVSPNLRELASTAVLQRPMLNIRGLQALAAPAEPLAAAAPVASNLAPGRLNLLRGSLLTAAAPLRAPAVSPVPAVEGSPPPGGANKGLLNRLLVGRTLNASTALVQPSLALKADFTRLVLTDPAATATKPTEFSNFTMAFDYCVVQVHRFWFDMKLVNYAKLWYSLAQTENCYSNGAKDSSNRGTLKAIPKAFIIIKNLKINANWSANDLHDAQNSMGLGFFNLLHSSVDANNQLVNPSLQIIGWLCEVPPKIPLTNDPHLS